MVVLQRTKRYTTTLFNLSTVKEKKESFFFSFSDCCWFGSTLVFWSWSIRPHPKHSGCLWSLPHSSMFHSLLFSVFFFLFLFFACRTPYGFPQFFTWRPKKKKKPSSMRAPQVQRSSCGVRVCRSTQGSNSLFSFFFLLLSIFTSLSVFSCACYYYFYKLGPGHTNRVTKSLDFPSFFFFI